MSNVVVEITMSLDGYVAGPNPSLEDPLGQDGERLHEWALDAESWRELHGLEGGSKNVDSELIQESFSGTGAVVMGRKMFSGGSGGWENDPRANGWWGDEPPFHTPVFVMTHHPRPPIDFPNGTSFRFVDGSPHEVLRLAQEAADGRDVRLGGGPSTVRQFLQADLVDFMHLVIVPITLGRGVSLWEGADGIEDRFTVESVASSSGLVHQLWNKN